MFKTFLEENNTVAIDYETTGFNPYKGDRIFAFVVTNWNCESKIYRFDHTSAVKKRVAQEVFEFFHKDDIKKVAHNAKFEMGFTSMYFDGVLPKSFWHDTYIMSKILKNILPRHKLETLADRYFRDMMPEDAEMWEFYDKQVKKHMTTQKRLMNNYPKRVEPEILQPLWDNGITPLITDRPNYGLIPVSIMKGYQDADGVRCMLLFRLMLSKIKEDERIWEDYLNELHLLKVTQKMEQRGMMIHKRNSDELIRKLQNDLKDIEKQKKKIFGFDINLDSCDQLQKHLFGYINPKKHETLNEEWKRHRPVFNLTPNEMTAGGAPSASKENILALQKHYPNNRVLDMILRYRAWAKGQTMIYSYQENAGENHIIHPTTNTNEAKTGRQSVSNPNLQNVAKEFSVNTVYGIPARRCFRPRPGYVYMLGDYAGIEMRLIIAASGQEDLIEAMNNDPDYDVHSDNATVILAKDFTGITDSKKIKSVRADVKNATFGRCYGANLPTWSSALRQTVEEAKPGWERFAEKRNELFNFTKNMMIEVKEHGFITSAFGRKLRVDKEYYAANYRIQGDAAGILKRAQNNVDDYILGVHDGDYDKLAMLLTVHDEIIFEMHRSCLEDKNYILHDLAYCMTDVEEIKVPLGVEWKISTTNWQDAKDYMP